VRTTCEATYAGIAAVAPGRSLREIGRAVTALAESRGFGVVRDYGGHGIGRAFHAAPHVPHIDDPSASLVFRPGMTFTVEPMLTAGTVEHDQAADGWTETTRDRLPSAQFEHTVVVTEDGAEILTVTSGGATAVRWPMVAAITP
jgi:methionyl aminopeptidase